uniref:Uncharacterized protein n=1 Tax=Anguilla anguilla TaxID=7936 RepID=A0A0E9S1D7_ANGAN
MALSIEGDWKLWTLWMLCRHSIYSNNRMDGFFCPSSFLPSFFLSFHVLPFVPSGVRNVNF